MRIIMSLLLGLVISAGAEPLHTTGLVLPYQQVDLAVALDGVVTDVLVKEGDAITNGQVIARLDSPRETLEVDYQKAILEKRIADLAAAESLFNEKIFSKNQLDERRIEAKLAETQYLLAQQTLQDRSIRAPLTGIVLHLHKQRGAVLHGGSLHNLEHIADVADLSQVVVTLYLDAANLLRVKPGQVAEVTVPLLGAETFTGVVDVVDPVVDPASGQFRAKVVVNNPARKIRTGTRANVVIQEPPTDVPAR